jgi:hypothetical protein
MNHVIHRRRKRFEWWQKSQNAQILKMIYKKSAWLSNVNFNVFSIMDAIQWVIGPLSPSIKQLECEANDSLLFSANVKHPWSCTSMYSYIFIVRCSGKHRDKYAFLFHSPMTDKFLWKQCFVSSALCCCLVLRTY